MQRVAIFGSGGQLGVELKSEFSRRGWQVVAFERAKVDITDPAIVAAAELSNRYITDRFLPDKAIDLVDEAASRLRIELDSMPAEIDSIIAYLKTVPAPAPTPQPASQNR